jgi:hypothetical protein
MRGEAMADLELYERVRVVTLPPNYRWSSAGFSKRAPRVGDVCYIIEVYEGPRRGLELECSDPRTGETEWMETFDEAEIGLERAPS